MGIEGFSALLVRVEAAEGPDRELDARIWCVLNERTFAEIALERVPYSIATPSFVKFAEGGALRLSTIEAVTASLDASLALCERVLPGWCIATIGQQDGGWWWVELREGHRTSYNRVADSDARIRFKTPAVALLAAMLRALIALSAPSHPPAPWPFGHAHNAKHAGWNAYFGGKGRDASPFPPVRRDLHAGFAEGWDAAKAAAS